MGTSILIMMIATVFFADPVLHSAQTPPEVETVKSSWRKLPARNPSSAKKDQQMRIGQLNAMIGLEMQKDPKDRDLGAIARLRDEIVRIERNQVTIDSFNRSNKAYEYRFKFKNHSVKEVAALAWSYVFIDPVSGKELSRLRFRSKTRLKPGNEDGLTAYSDSGPPMLVNAESAAKSGSAWKENVIIEKIEFSDGSIWMQSGS